VLADLETAPIAEPLRATLRMLRELARTHAVTAGDMRALLAAGVSSAQIRDALAVSFCFNVIDRLADTFHFDVPEPAAFKMAAKMLLGKRGYKM
jgi:alkylhydroperoxidase family enzyme